MEDENEYKKLPTEDKCVHNMWKARIAGYEEAIKLFNQIDDEKSPEWNKYLGLIKKFVSDNNAVAQERGLEAALVFVENCGHAGKTTGEVMSGIVAKCIAAPKTKTKDLALQVTLMYVEIEKHEVVQEELMKGMDQKNPKVVTACISALNSALKQFGNKVIGIKPMVKKIPVLLADRDKGVRGEMKALVVEMHRWIGPAIEPHIASLQPVVQQELREAFGSNETAVPTRYLRSQQQKMADRVVRTQDEGDGECEDDDNEAGAGDSADLDPYDMMDPIEILSKIPKDFYEKVEQSKWQIRKEGLDCIDNLLKHSPRLEPGDYGDLVRALKKIIGKDSNVMLVALAGRLLALLASGLRAKFSPYAAACCQTILEKFKEKKVNVVTALREAIDAIYPSTNLEAIMEDLLAAFSNKNPSVKTESALFMSRALSRTQPAAFGKKLVKAYVPALLKLLDCAEPAVREAAAEALGTATKLVGEKAIAPHIDKLDNLKEQKIKEYTDKAVIQVKVAAPKKDKGKPAARGDAPKNAGSSDPKPVKRSTTATKKAAPKKAAVAKASPSPPREPELSQEEVDEKAETIFSDDILSGLSQSNWQQRLTSVQGFLSTVQGLTPEDVSGQVLMRTLTRKPGFKDTNVQVLKTRLDAAKYILDNFPVTIITMEPIIPDLVIKLGEPACSGISGTVLSAAAASCGASCVVAAAVNGEVRGPKAQAELLTWLGTMMQEHSSSINIKPIIAHCKKCLQATNPAIRQATITLLGSMSQYTGPSLLSHFESEKPATKQLISLEIDKYAGTNPSTPTRITKSSSRASVADDIDDNYDDQPEDESVPVDDNKPRTDIAPLITDGLIEEISDKNWKVRDEALKKLKTIISTSSPIKSSLGELPPALVARLVDSNSKLAQTALQICESLAVAMGTKCRQHVRTFFPGFLQAFGDNKTWIRQSSLSCVDAWCTAAGTAGVALEGDITLDALKTGSPLLRTTLWTWLSERLPLAPPKSFPRDDLSSIVPILYVCIEDRSPDVRRSATACVLPVMTHLGYEAMARQLERLKPGSKTVVQAALDKSRALLPVQPLPSKPKKEDSKGVKSGGALKKDTEKKAVVTGKAKGIVKPGSAASRNKKEDEDFTPLLPNNNAKNQRIIDDQKLKVLKWNFTTPREEFFELLKEQMATAGLNKQLVANMFHADFRYHIKAIESLSEDLHDNGSSLVANLDLILKWLTLRFFDTNPSVILKGLEYLAQVFTYLIEIDYTMAEYEANCFIPYLTLKVGDPKDTVRNGVRALFKQICVVYSVTKLFGYLMEGLKSKNARQRAECLDCIGHLLETYGSVVMSGGTALRELARHIGDRDNAVRSNALNCIAVAYFLEGEKIYRMIGQISDKDLSLLEERIKRATKTRSAESRRSMIVPLTAAGKPIVQHDIQEQEPRRIISVDTQPGDYYEDEPEEEEDPQPLPPPEVKSSPPRIVSGPYGLDPELVARLDAEIPRVPKTNLPELDLRFLDEPVPTVHTTRGNLPTMSPRSIPPASAPPSSMSQIPQQTIDDARLADTIHSIGSPDIHTAIRALSLVSGAVSTGRAAALTHNYDRLLAALAAQLTSLRTSQHAPHDALHAYKCISAVLTNLYESGAAASSPNAGIALSSLLCELLKVLGGGIHDERVVRLLNNVCVRLLEHADRCHLLCSIVSLLHESIGVTDDCSPRYQDLLLKCFWKTLKMMSSWDIANVRLEPAMLAVHRFYKAYPNAYWKKNPDVSDTPYKTVKTLVHTLVKMKGTSIMNHLPQDPNIKESELYLYLLKVFKQLKLDDKNLPDTMNGNVLHTVSLNTSQLASAHDRTPRAMHDELANILKKFGNKQQVPEAFEELRDFTEAHPSVDIWTYMQGSSFYFRNFVERGLRDLRDMRPTIPNYTSRVTDSVDVTNENDDKSHIVFLERLRALQAKAGMKIESPGSNPRTPIDNRVLCDEDPLRKSILDPQLQLNTTSITSQRNEAGVDALRLKLQQIKSSSKR